MHSPESYRRRDETDYFFEYDLYRTPMSQKLALAMRDAHGKNADVDYISEDVKLAEVGGQYGCPTYVT